MDQDKVEVHEMRKKNEKEELSSLNSFGRSFQSFAEAYLKEDCPIADDMVLPKSDKVISLRDFLCTSDRLIN